MSADSARNRGVVVKSSQMASSSADTLTSENLLSKPPTVHPKNGVKSRHPYSGPSGLRYIHLPATAHTLSPTEPSRRYPWISLKPHTFAHQSHLSSQHKTYLSTVPDSYRNVRLILNSSVTRSSSPDSTPFASSSNASNIQLRTYTSRKEIWSLFIITRSIWNSIVKQNPGTSDRWLSSGKPKEHRTYSLRQTEPFRNYSTQPNA